MHAVDIKDLNKVFISKKTKQKINALNNINLKIPKGSLFAILGLNGAGKSTLINILSGLTLKNSGSVKINGYDIDKKRKDDMIPVSYDKNQIEQHIKLLLK